MQHAGNETMMVKVKVRTLCSYFWEFKGILDVYSGNSSSFQMQPPILGQSRRAMILTNGQGNQWGPSHRTEVSPTVSPAEDQTEGNKLPKQARIKMAAVAGLADHPHRQRVCSCTCVLEFSSDWLQKIFNQIRKKNCQICTISKSGGVYSKSGTIPTT